MYKKVKAGEVPKRGRKAVSLFETTPEWALMKADIDAGLRLGEALQVQLSEADLAKYGISTRRTIDRFVKRYLEAKGLRYGVKSFMRDGYHFVAVEN